MEFTPRYSQPFTLQEAVVMDVPVITEEITRLQNSLQHLRDTQRSLQGYIAEDADPELTKAYDENQAVIGSQEERIHMLKFALIEKGIHFNEHYDLEPSKLSTEDSPTPSTITGSAQNQTTGLEDDNDNGLHL